MNSRSWYPLFLGSVMTKVCFENHGGFKSLVQRSEVFLAFDLGRSFSPLEFSFRRVVFKEYDQKLEALSSINVPEAIEEFIQEKVLTEMKKQLHAKSGSSQ
ncbi:hypothetical protein Tco_0684243 [Tanacetum coccineum]